MEQIIMLLSFVTKQRKSLIKYTLLLAFVALVAAGLFISAGQRHRVLVTREYQTFEREFCGCQLRSERHRLVHAVRRTLNASSRRVQNLG